MVKYKTTDYAAKVLKEIMAEVNKDVIKEYEIPNLFSFDTCKETGFAVILTLNTKYAYTCDVLNKWKKRLHANNYQISVRCNQLRVRFDVKY